VAERGLEVSSSAGERRSVYCDGEDDPGRQLDCDWDSWESWRVCDADEAGEDVESDGCCGSCCSVSSASGHDENGCVRGE
jgi:hypothetical protein